jgi:hypothetical protein
MAGRSIAVLMAVQSITVPANLLLPSALQRLRAPTSIWLALDIL